MVVCFEILGGELLVVFFDSVYFRDESGGRSGELSLLLPSVKGVENVISCAGLT